MVDDEVDREDPAREGLEHLQAAAREMIAAARSMLDACEEVLEDPRAAAAVSGAMGAVARFVGGLGAPAAAPEADGPRVKRIKVS